MILNPGTIGKSIDAAATILSESGIENLKDAMEILL